MNLLQNESPTKNLPSDNKTQKLNYDVTLDEPYNFEEMVLHQNNLAQTKVDLKQIIKNSNTKTGGRNLKPTELSPSKVAN